MVEYLSCVLIAGCVALLAGGDALGGDTLDGEIPCGEGPRGEVRFGGVVDAVRGAGGAPAGVLKRDGGPGGGSDGASGMISPVSLSTAPPNMEDTGTTSSGRSLSSPLPFSWSRSCFPSNDGECSSARGKGVAISVPGLLIGNSSSVTVDAFADPGLRMGNSSSSTVLGIGIGAEMMAPRIDFLVLARAPAGVPELDLPNMLGILIGVVYNGLFFSFSLFFDNGNDRLLGKEGGAG